MHVLEKMLPLTRVRGMADAGSTEGELGVGRDDKVHAVRQPREGWPTVRLMVVAGEAQEERRFAGVERKTGQSTKK
jgi:hypothetical protein